MRNFAHYRRVRLVAASAVVALGLASLPAQPAGAASSGPQVLRVGTYQGIAGQYTTIEAAVKHARPGDWILIAPGDYHARDDHDHPPTPAQATAGSFAGVLITTPNLHVRGMNRTTTVIDGSLPSASAPCSGAASAQDPGVSAKGSSPYGRNGIEAYKASGVSIENLTVCNFRTGSGDSGNQIWWNGGDDTGAIGLGSFYGAYLTATSTYFGDDTTAAAYGLFSSNSDGPGMWDHVYGSNFSDSPFYIGACGQQCNQVIDDAHAQYSSTGFAGTNSGGSLVVENSTFDHNKTGFDTNSQNSADAPSPQEGACPNGEVSPITHTHSCWVFMHNVVADNNNHDVPGNTLSGESPVGVGVLVAGGRNDTIMDNTITGNGGWGSLFVPYPDSSPPAAGQTCQGGIATGSVCTFDDYGNVLQDNTFSGNGFFGNPSNSDFGEITANAGHPINCYVGNTDPDGSSPPTLQTTNTTCGTPGVPDPNPPLAAQLVCDTQAFSIPCVGANYPRRTAVVMHPLPSNLPTMPDPCAGVPANPWCPAPTGSGTASSTARR